VADFRNTHDPEIPEVSQDPKKFSYDRAHREQSMYAREFVFALDYLVKQLKEPWVFRPVTEMKP
jgi:hypothetical protein